MIIITSIIMNKKIKNKNKINWIWKNEPLTMVVRFREWENNWGTVT